MIVATMGAHEMSIYDPPTSTIPRTISTTTEGIPKYAPVSLVRIILYSNHINTVNPKNIRIKSKKLFIVGNAACANEFIFIPPH